jgi:hypothetical protein
VNATSQKDSSNLSHSIHIDRCHAITPRARISAVDEFLQGHVQTAMTYTLDCEQFRIDSEVMAVNNRERMRLRNKKHRERLEKILLERSVSYCVAPIA